MDDDAVFLGGRPFKVAVLPFGALKKTLPIILRVSGQMDNPTEASMDDLMTVIHAAIQASGDPITRDELEAVPVTLTDLMIGFVKACRLAGLEAKAMGEALAGMGPTGTGG